MNLASQFQFSSSLVAILDAGDGRVVDLNPEFERQTGYARAELIGRNTIDIGIWPNQETRAMIWAHLRSDRSVSGQRVVLRTRDGTELAATLSCEIFEHDGASYIFSIWQQVGPAGAQDHTVSADPGSYRALFMAAATGLYRSLPDGGWIDVNPALAHIFGYESPAQMLAETATSRASVLYADAAQIAHLYATLAQHGRFENERAQVRRRNGSLGWIVESARAVRDAHGRTLFFEGSVSDITAQLDAEARLRQSETMYRTLVDNSHDGVFLIRHDGSIGFINEAMAATLGYRAEDLTGTNYMRLIAPESLAAQSVRRKERHDGSLNLQNYDATMLRKDGSMRLLHVQAGAVHYEGEVASIGTARDITEEQNQRDALEQAERTYRELFQNSVAGMFRSLPDGRIAAANDAFARILGYASADALLASGRVIGEFYADPEHRRAVLTRIAASREALTFEFDARRCDGGIVHAEVRAQAIRDAAGNPQWVEGSAQDISARRRAEVALRESEARYRTLVEHSQVGVYMMLEDRYTYVNQAFATLFGYAEDELIGTDFRRLVPPESSQQMEARYRVEHVGETAGRDYRAVLVRKDGQRIDVVVSAGRVEMNGKSYTSGTVRDVTAQMRVQRELEHNASHDLLTGLPNRVFFERQLEQAIVHAQARGNYHYAVLFFDLDGFKLVNDSLGHASGDALLVQIAASLRTNLGNHCLVSRYGGDEFTLLAHDSCPRAHAEQLAQRVLALLAGSFEVAGHRVFSGASVGVVLGSAEYQSPDQVLRDADTAMYRAKASGKSAYVIFDEAMHAAARDRLQLETDLRFALERGEFRVFYQPIVDLRNAAVTGCEALVRWQHPQRGLLLPSQFLAVAEESGMLVAMDWWVLEQTCHNLTRWQRCYPAHARLRVGVNMDERQFADINMLQTLHDILQRTSVDPAALSLEITETVFRRGRSEAVMALNGLKELGVSLVVDDFGTGYSSLDSFAASPFDALKIDRSFVRDMATNFRHRAIVRTTARFAEDLGLSLIAEGVEAQEQVQLLRNLGCAQAQGFLFAPALCVRDMERILEHGLDQGLLKAGVVA